MKLRSRSLETRQLWCLALVQGSAARAAFQGFLTAVGQCLPDGVSGVCDTVPIAWDRRSAGGIQGTADVEVMGL